MGTPDDFTAVLSRVAERRAGAAAVEWTGGVSTHGELHRLASEAGDELLMIDDLEAVTQGSPASPPEVE